MIKTLLIPGLAVLACAVSALMSTPTTETPPVKPLRRLGSFEQAAAEHQVSSRTMRNYLGRGYFKAYRIRGVRGVLLDLDEVDAAMRRLPRKLGKAGFGSYGPKAEIIDLPPRAVIVNDRLGSDR